MPIDWIMGLVGGLMIGTAGAVYLLINGRIMGASGILGGLIDGSGRDSAGERLALLVGLFAVPAVLAIAMGGAQTKLTENIPVIIIAGILVGVGTRMAGGCTSGHGVCGISRLTLRGIVATVFYILAGGIVMVAFRHWLGVI